MTDQIVNELGNSVDKKEERKSVNRSAVKMDMRASTDSNREAVKNDMRSTGNRNTVLAPAYEQSDEDSSDEDPFKHLSKTDEETKVSKSIVK